MLVGLTTCGGSCIATVQYSSLCVNAMVLFLSGFDHIEVDEQDREQVDSERGSRSTRERERKKTKKETMLAQKCDGMCKSDFCQ